MWRKLQREEKLPWASCRRCVVRYIDNLKLVYAIWGLCWYDFWILVFYETFSGEKNLPCKIRLYQTLQLLFQNWEGPSHATPPAWLIYIYKLLCRSVGKLGKRLQSVLQCQGTWSCIELCSTAGTNNRAESNFRGRCSWLCILELAQTYISAKLMEFHFIHSFSIELLHQAVFTGIEVLHWAWPLRMMWLVLAAGGAGCPIGPTSWHGPITGFSSFTQEISSIASMNACKRRCQLHHHT